MNTCASSGAAFQEGFGVDEHCARQTGALVESISCDLGIVDRELDDMCISTFPDSLCGNDGGIIMRLYVWGERSG